MHGRTVRIGFLGTGYIAEYHASALRSIHGTELAAVCDLNFEQATKFSNKNKGVPVYTSLTEMLAKEKLDVVHVLVPAQLHFQQILTLVRSGCHVFSEKPMCLSSSEANEILKICKSNNKFVGVDHNFLFFPAYEQLREDVFNQKFGSLDHVEIKWCMPFTKFPTNPSRTWLLREPGNLIHEIGPHLVGFILDLIGMPDELKVRASNAIQFDSGQKFFRRWQVYGEKRQTTIELHISLTDGFPDRSIHVRGPGGMGVCDYERNAYLLLQHQPYPMVIDHFRSLVNQGDSLRRQGWANFRKYVWAKLSRSKLDTPFAISIYKAIRSFYGQLCSGQSEYRVSKEFAAEIVEATERIANGAPSSAPDSNLDVTYHVEASLSPKILVLGGTGFIGRHLVRQLTEEGHAVRLITRRPHEFVSDVEGVELVQGQFGDRKAVGAALSGIEYVYHLSRIHSNDWNEYYQKDVLATKQVADLCLAHGVKRLIYTSSISAYYSGPSNSPIMESTPLDPKIARRDAYARAKKATEELLFEMHQQLKLPVVIVRPGIVIGQGGSPFHWGVGWWHYNLICQLWGDGYTALPIVLVKDVVSAMILAMQTPNIEGESFNLVGDTLINAREYVDLCSEASGLRLKAVPTTFSKFYTIELLKYLVKILVRHPNRKTPFYRDWITRSHAAGYDNSKAKEVLGWKPTQSRDQIIEQGIRLPIREWCL